jgi:hypothetical protein
MISFLMASSIAQAQPDQVTEYQVKAAFLYNFAKFVEWPAQSFASAAAPLKICVLGANPFDQDLRAVTADKTVNGHKLMVSEVSDVQQARTCHILFVAAASRKRSKQILEALQGANVLTVSDSAGFAEDGGVINFVLSEGRVHFIVNHKAANACGLTISARLLTVARVVIE